ncbi:MAG: glycosyltransferase family 39 protein [Chloroflexi bacterium]|nr:glycosyltransferase family 39 protein [Chloroflexota bacterium]
MIQSLRNGIDELITRHLNALALCDSDTSCPVPWPLMVGTLALHLAGLAAFWRYYHQPIWLAVPTIAFLLAPAVMAGRRSRPLAVETLAPLFFLYAILIARVIAVRFLLAAEPYQDEASFADPRLIFFQVEATAAAVIAYTAMVVTVQLTKGKLRTRLLLALAGLFAAAALVWFASEAIGHRTRGVTASDPYAYVQMAVDLATHGDPLHTFSLFPYLVNSNLPWYPIEHVGYRLFSDLSGRAATVWPFGGSVILALAYRLLGEKGLYLTTPLAACASLLALALLAWEYFRYGGTVERAAIAALSVALLATSWEQVDRSIVPLVDAEAQFFSVIAIWMMLRAARTERTVLSGIIAGAALGTAYFIRHTQVLVAIPMIVAVWSLPRRKRWELLVAAGSAAVVVALPDLWYHQDRFGNWFTPESQELVLFSFANIVSSARALSERFLAGNEFGYLIFFLLYGAYRAARENWRQFAVIATWILVLTGFQLLYAAVRLRDLLPEYPAVVMLTAYGMVGLGRDLRGWVERRALQFRAGKVVWARGAVAVVLFLTLLLPAMRTRITILRPFEPVRITFGYVTSAQRASFDRIAALTPSDAVIGSTMNDGPIDLYAKRATFRPGVWNSTEYTDFVDMMLKAGRPVYILNDGAETSSALVDAGAHYSLRQVTVLDVPLFGTVDGPAGALWEINEK